MTVYVISTMTDSVGYTFFQKVGDLPIPKEKIIIRGGASLPSLKSGFGDMTKDGEGHPMWTSEGMVTPIDDAKFDRLKEHWLFKKHLDAGVLKVVNHDIDGDYKAVKKEIKTMESGWEIDKSRQITPDTIKARIGNKNLQIHNMKDGESDFRI